MGKHKKLVSGLVAIFVLATLVGCQVSKANYRDEMKQVLDEAGKKLDSSTEKLQKVSGKPKEIEKERKKLIEEQLDILKETKDRIEGITPPDDLFSGHANLVSFLDLYIKYREKQSETGTKSPKSSEVGEQPFELYQAATSAFSRASTELSFLQYEFRKAFYNLLTSERPEQRMMVPGPQTGPGSTTAPSAAPPVPGR